MKSPSTAANASDKNKEDYVIKNIEFLSTLNKPQRSYVLSLMMKGIYYICPEKLKELESL